MRIHGRVEARKHACEVGRTVKYFRRNGKLMGEDRTNNDGRWEFVTAPHPGRFYAKVVRREVDIAGTTFVCRHDRTAMQDFH